MTMTMMVALVLAVVQLSIIVSLDALYLAVYSHHHHNNYSTTAVTACNLLAILV